MLTCKTVGMKLLRNKLKGKYSDTNMFGLLIAWVYHWVTY